MIIRLFIISCKFLISSLTYHLSKIAIIILNEIIVTFTFNLNEIIVTFTIIIITTTTTTTIIFIIFINTIITIYNDKQYQ